MLHGRANSKDNSKVMENFISGKIQILVCTTMIEVGVDVANATCIVIEDPDRFGLSQLHQLRGRVGRSSKQSFCYLVCKNDTSNQALERLKALTLYSSGFNIAEEDLKLRGSGDYLGYKQSGANHNFKLATPEDALHNYDLVRDSMNYIDKIDKKNKNKLIKRWGKDSTDTIQL
jgi:ATP-dependent DNA helicase RecG